VQDLEEAPVFPLLSYCPFTPGGVRVLPEKKPKELLDPKD
jgi:hypothetical protein